MWKRGWDFEKTQLFVKERRGVSSPNAGFICQLLFLGKRLGMVRQGLLIDKHTRLYNISEYRLSAVFILMSRWMLGCKSFTILSVLLSLLV